MSKGDYFKAIDDYTALIGMQPEDAETHFRRGTAYAEEHQFDSAIGDYTEAIQRKDDYVDAYIARADALAKKADRDGAIKDYVALMKLLPEDKARLIESKLIENYRGRAQALTVVGKFDKAITDLSEVLRLRRNDINSRLARASATMRSARAVWPSMT